MDRMNSTPAPPPEDPYANETAAEKRERGFNDRAASFSDCNTPTNKQKKLEAEKQAAREAAMMERSASLSPKSSPKSPTLTEDAAVLRAAQFSECSTPSSTRKKEEEAKKAAREQAMADRAMAL